MTTLPTIRPAAGTVETVIRARRSTIRLTEPAPGPDELLGLLAAAAPHPTTGSCAPGA
ncbi:hypothetical protein [Streptomyces flaveolus]|uniref:hypothetical protein n=1 Tax=Streptomyces flaveolus TaxID=67297 RepID=UPI0037FE1744